MARATLPGMQPTLRGGAVASLDTGENPKLQWNQAGADAHSILFDQTMRYSDIISSRGATQLSIGVDVDSTGVGAPAQQIAMRIIGIGDDDTGTPFVQSGLVAGAVANGLQQWLVNRNEFYFADLDEKQFIDLPFAWQSFQIGVRAVAAPTANQLVVISVARLLGAGAAALHQ